MDKEIAQAILRRIDDLERRVMARIDVHDKFRAKFMGGLAVIVFLVPIFIEWIKH